MNKKFLSLVLALVMVLGTFGNVFAAAATDKKEVKEVPKLTTTEAKAKWLIDNKYVVGTADKDGKATGNMDLKSPIRRDAVAKMLVFAIGEQDLAAKLQGVYTPFPDVKVDNIMNGFIAAAASSTANGVPIIVGYQDGTFRPTKNVSYAELAKMLVVAIDKELTPAKAASYSWPQGWMDRAARLGIFEGLSIADANKAAVRSDAFAMIYNAFYQLKELKAVPANETRGIISEHRSKDTLVLNQGDFKKEFKVNESTVFVNLEGKNQLWIGGRTVDKNYYVGSLVRVLTDKDGVVSHIIEMGNPYDGVNTKNEQIAWQDLGKIELKKDSSFVRKTDATKPLVKFEERKEIKKVAVGDDTITFTTGAGAAAKDAVYNVTSKTEFYVADYEGQALTRVKDFAAAKALLPKDVEAVYLGYEVLPAKGGNEARIVVFNEIDKKQNERVVRVSKAVSNPTYMLTVQAPGENATAPEEFDLRNDSTVWPYNNGFKALDVLAPVNNKYNKDTKFLIKHEEAPVVKIENFYLVKEDGSKKVVDRANANLVRLIDKDEHYYDFALPTDYNAFFGKDLKVGAHVQYANTGAKIDVLSEVGTEALRGNIDNGIPAYLKVATVKLIDKVDNSDLYRVVVNFEDSKKDVILVASKDVVDGSTTPAGDALVPGKEYKLLLDNVNKKHNPNEIVRATLTDAQKAKDKAAQEALDAFNENVKKVPAEAADYKDDKALKDDNVADAKKKVEDLKKEFTELKTDQLKAEDVQKAKDALNKAIKAFNEAAKAAKGNGLTGDHSIEPVK